MKYGSIKNKKAMVFTIIVILIILLFSIIYTTYSISFKERSVINRRIKSMNSFLYSVEKDLERKAYIFGFRTIMVLNEHIAITGEYISNLDQAFNEAFFNGSVYGQQKILLNGARFPDIMDSINANANKINVNITIENPEILIKQEDPWNVIVVLSFNLKLSDKSGLAEWKKQENISSIIDIQGFEDPLYIANTQGKITNIINRTKFEGDYVSGTDVSNLTLHLQNGLYTTSSLAPSFLDRLQGNTGPNPFGIESLVNLQRLSEQGISVKEKTVVDYLYFSTQETTDYRVEGMPNWFRIDSAHIDKYQVQGLTY